MDFIHSLISDEQRQLVTWVEQLANGPLAAIEARVGETNRVSRELVDCLADAGLLDWTVPGDWRTGRASSAASTPAPADGTPTPPLESPEHMSLVSFCLVREALARRCPNAELIFAMQGLGAGPISFCGSADQRRRYLPQVAEGVAVAAFALTEPETGSDVSALQLEARRDGDAYILNGRKTLISMAPDADMYTVFARTTDAAGDRSNGDISAFIVEKGTPGFDPGQRIELLAPHPIGEPVFSDCRVAAENRIGEEGDGVKIAMTTLGFFRTMVAACAVGFAQRAFDEALAYAKRRRAFGKPIATFQAIQAKLADMSTELAAARLLVYRAAMLRDSGQRPRLTLEGSQAKLFATEAAQRIIDQAVQIHGGAGVVKGSEVERLYREICALRIYEGTSEIQQLVIARELLRD